MHFVKLFEDYHLRCGPKRQHDPEGFFSLFRQSIKGGKFVHEFNFPKDLIRNEFDLNRQDLNKEKWIAYDKLLDIVHKMDLKYDPLLEFSPYHKKIDFLMKNFKEIMDTLRTKKINLKLSLGMQEQSVGPIETRSVY